MLAKTDTLRAGTVVASRDLVKPMVSDEVAAVTVVISRGPPASATENSWTLPTRIIIAPYFPRRG
jgi:aspartate oxidase